MSARILRQWPKRTNEVDLSLYSFPGAYPLVGITDDGASLCAECVIDERETIQEAIPGDGWYLSAVIAHEADDDENDPLRCDHCGREVIR